MSKFKHQFNQKLKDSHHISGRETPCITGSDRSQTVMFPPFVDDYVSCDNQVRFIDAYGRIGFIRFGIYIFDTRTNRSPIL